MPATSAARRKAVGEVDSTAGGARALRWLRDPLFAFLLIGAGVFALERWWQGWQADAAYTIVISNAEAARLGALWRTQTGRAPTQSELVALLEDHIREEILVREARRLRLDEGDAIVRRRLAQKLAFLTDDIAALEPATDADLRAHFDANRSRYETPAAITFSHIYFSPDKRADAKAAAQSALATLDPAAWRTSGDPFMLGRTYAHASTPRLRKDFGDEFAEQLAGLPAAGEWRGPLRSAYGYHLVRVDANAPARSSRFEAVQARVAADFDAARRAKANREHFEQLRSQYTVKLPAAVTQLPQPAAPSKSAPSQSAPSQSAPSRQ